MAKDSFAGRVLSALTKLAVAGNGEVGVGDLSAELMIKTRQAYKQMLNALSDLYKSGRVRRPRQGMYSPAPQRKMEIRDVMWRTLRMRKAVTVEDLMELACASEGYADQWLLMLERRCVVRREGTHFRLIKDTVEMPRDDEKAAKLRELRRRKKEQAMAALERAQSLIGEAYLAIEVMEAGHE